MSVKVRNRIISKFRNEFNQLYTKQLFLEQSMGIAVEDRAIKPIYTLHDTKEGYINFRKEYLEDEDPTGYTTAVRLLDGWEHWLKLMRSAWFQDAKAAWDRELDAKLAARALKKINEIAQGDSGSALNAAKYLANKEYKNSGPKRGRPSKQEVEGELKNEVANARELEDDLKRIRAVE